MADASVSLNAVFFTRVAELCLATGGDTDVKNGNNLKVSLPCTTK